MPDGGNFVEIGSNTGRVVGKCAGDVSITATKAGDDYNDNATVTKVDNVGVRTFSERLQRKIQTTTK